MDFLYFIKTTSSTLFLVGKRDLLHLLKEFLSDPSVLHFHCTLMMEVAKHWTSTVPFLRKVLWIYNL